MPVIEQISVAASGSSGTGIAKALPELPLHIQALRKRIHGDVKDEKPQTALQDQRDSKPTVEAASSTSAAMGQIPHPSDQVLAIKSKSASVTPERGVYDHFLETLRQQGQRSKESLCSKSSNGLVDRSRCSFATALQHLESRMGKV